MPLNVRSISVKTGVIIFFVVAIIGSVANLSPLTCSLRAMGAGALAAVTAGVAARIINSIVIRAMVETHFNRQRKNSK